jgi:hypothetical protein
VGRTSRRSLAWGLLFVLGVYLLGAGYGNHEITNYLHARFCETPTGVDRPADLCRIVVFNDDEFSHWVFFAGFTLTNVAMMLIQGDHPYGGTRSRLDHPLVVANAMVLSAGVFANLAFEEIGLDLYVVAAVAIAALAVMQRRGREPLILYFVVAYWLALIATLIVKGFGL